MDNTGAYVTYKELFERLYPSSYVSEKSQITLSNKSVNTFEYMNNTFPLQLGDVVCQGEYAKTITALPTTPTRLTLDDATNITNGVAYVFRLGIKLWEFDILRTMAMQKIDLYTGQWFNKRTISPVYEGNNSHILHFPVPIIEITSLKINNATTDVDPNKYMVFKSRTLPDDRRNPRIKLIDKTRDIYTQTDLYWDGIFYRGRFTTIVGSFGFLEEDGSTPEAIKWCTSRLVMLELTRDPEGLNTLKIKREKTDLHEIEYDTTNKSGKSLQSSITGDEEIDRVLQLYKAPMSIGGTDPMYATIEGFYKDYRYV